MNSIVSKSTRANRTVGIGSMILFSLFSTSLRLCVLSFVPRGDGKECRFIRQLRVVLVALKLVVTRSINDVAYTSEITLYWSRLQ